MIKPEGETVHLYFPCWYAVLVCLGAAGIPSLWLAFCFDASCWPWEFISGGFLAGLCWLWRYHQNRELNVVERFRAAAKWGAITGLLAAIWGLFFLWGLMGLVAVLWLLFFPAMLIGVVYGLLCAYLLELYHRLWIWKIKINQEPEEPNKPDGKSVSLM